MGNGHHVNLLRLQVTPRESGEELVTRAEREAVARCMLGAHVGAHGEVWCCLVASIICCVRAILLERREVHPFVC